MAPDRPMYQWRRMTEDQRREALRHRQELRRPWHAPPHFAGRTGIYLVTAACYEHRPVIGFSPERMAGFESDLLTTVNAHADAVSAWVVLPNHYHVLANTPDLTGLLAALGRLHGRASYVWNGEERCRGRQVWHRAAETAIKSERHFWAALNYVLHNSVRHGYVERWSDWPYSNAADYLADVGRDEAERRWREYPLFDFGAEWDPPDL